MIVGSAIVGMFALAGTAFAATTATAHRGGNFARPAVIGTVSATNGETLTVTGKGFGQNATGTTYTVDATNATVAKNNTTSSAGDVSAIAVGDTVMIQGTVSGTNVTAKTIRDGVMGGNMPRSGGRGEKAITTPAITGNGEPVVGGSVTAINDTTLTVTNKSDVTYTIDASNAIITKGGATTTLSSVATGDNVLVQGTVNGTSVVASSVIDQGATSAAPKHGAGGFLSAIGNFFTRIFGFF